MDLITICLKPDQVELLLSVLERNILQTKHEKETLKDYPFVAKHLSKDVEDVTHIRDLVYCELQVYEESE